MYAANIVATVTPCSGRCSTTICVAGLDLALLEHPEVDAGPAHPGEPLDPGGGVEALAAHPRLEGVARGARLDGLQQGAAHPPPLAQHRLVEVDAGGGEVLAEQPRADRPAELLLPPVEVLLRVGVDRLVGAAVEPRVPHPVALEPEPVHPDRSVHRRLVDRGLLRAPAQEAWTTRPTLTDTTCGFIAQIVPVPSGRLTGKCSLRFPLCPCGGALGRRPSSPH